MTPDELFAEFRSGFEGRKFSAGLLVAFIAFLKRLGAPEAGFASLNALLARYPRRLSTAAGKRANTLIVDMGGTTVSLRPFYNAAERYYRAEHKRFDYPSCAPHATQAWGDYVHWLDALLTFSEHNLDSLRDRVNLFVLDKLQSQAFDPASVSLEPPPFRLLLEDFDMTSRRGEPTGAAFQGTVFGFLRADNPHLQVEIDKVRTGSKRLQRVGDVDGWEGGRLAISTEVKQLVLKRDNVADLHGFANEVGRRGALGVIAALGFEEGARSEIEDLVLIALDIDDMLDIVELWDQIKQRTAVSSPLYYAKHVENNASLSSRLEQFVATAMKTWRRPGGSDEEPSSSS